MRKMDMEMKTKLLILASACLIALSFAACGGQGGQGGQENTTDPAEETVTAGASEDKSDATVSESTDSEPDETAPEETTASEPSDSVPEPSTPSDTTGKTEETQEVIGPVPPPPATEAPTEAPTEPPVPDFEGATTNEDGVIELPFVPFPDE